MLKEIIAFVVLLLCIIGGAILIVTTKDVSKKNKAKVSLLSLVMANGMAIIFIAQNTALMIVGVILTCIGSPVLSVFYVGMSFQKENKKVSNQIFAGMMLFILGLTFVLVIVFSVSYYLIL